MNAKQFFDKVVIMRKHQKEYYKTRSREALQASKALETEVDNEIQRVFKVLEAKKQPQQTSFNYQ